MKQFTKEALTLIISDTTGSITPQEQQQLNDLMRKHPQVKELSQFLYENPDTEEYPIDAPTEVEAYEFAQQLQNRRSANRKIIYRRIMGWAASILVAVTGITGVWMYSNKRSSSDISANIAATKLIAYIGNQKYDITGSKMLSIGKNRQLYLDNKKLLIVPEKAWQDTACRIEVPPRMAYLVKLADGTRLFLNSATVLTFPLLFSNKERTISVSGEAYAKVSASPAWKFVVNLPSSRVEAFGTEFNVSSYRKGENKVALISGNVRVSAGVKTTDLVPGYEATISDTAMTVDEFDDEEVKGWLSGTIYLQNVDDADIMNAAEIYYGQKVVIQRRSYDNRRMFSFNRNQPIDSFLSHVAGPENISKKEGIYYIK